MTVGPSSTPANKKTWRSVGRLAAAAGGSPGSDARLGRLDGSGETGEATKLGAQIANLPAWEVKGTHVSGAGGVPVDGSSARLSWSMLIRYFASHAVLSIVCA